MIAHTSKLTIVVPTLDRPEYLERLLRYYSLIAFDGQIIVGDSSNEANRLRNTAAIDSHADALNVRYEHYGNPPYVHDGMCQKAMAALVETPYVVYCGDDDFLVPAGLSACIAFLEEHDDFIAANGRRINFQLDRDGAYGTVEGIMPFIESEFLDESASARWAHYITNRLSTQYSVHRTAQWRVMYEHVDRVPSRYLGPEFLPCSLTAIQGKVKTVDALSLLFQVNCAPVVDWNKKTFFALMNAAEWSPSIAVTKDVIIEAILERSDLERDYAEQLVEMGIWQHVNGILLSQFQNLAEGKTQRRCIPAPQGKQNLEALYQDKVLRKQLAPALKVLQAIR